MIGRQVIVTARSFTMAELKTFMDQYWNKEEYNIPVIGKPTRMSADEYILLPATERYLVIIYPKAAGGFLNKENKIVLSVADSPAGAKEAFFTYMPVNTPITSLWQTSKVMNAEKERKGPAEEVLQLYTAHMKDILGRAGYLKQ